MKIDISDVKAVLGGSTIIENIDMSANGNELIGIIGPNGSGKSTLLKCIYRTLKPAAGAIMLDNTLLSDIPVKDSAKKVSVVAQHNFYNFEFSVEEVVLMGRSPYNKALERDNADDYRIVRESLEQVGCPDLPTAASSHSPEENSSASLWQGLSPSKLPVLYWTSQQITLTLSISFSLWT